MRRLPPISVCLILTGASQLTGSTATLKGQLKDLGKAERLEVGFEYRGIAGLDASDRSIPWQAGPTRVMTATGEFSMAIDGLKPNGVYEYRAWVKHPLLTIYGAEKRMGKP